MLCSRCFYTFLHLTRTITLWSMCYYFTLFHSLWTGGTKRLSNIPNRRTGIQTRCIWPWRPGLLHVTDLLAGKQWHILLPSGEPGGPTHFLLLDPPSAKQVSKDRSNNMSGSAQLWKRDHCASTKKYLCISRT